MLHGHVGRGHHRVVRWVERRVGATGDGPSAQRRGYRAPLPGAGGGFRYQVPVVVEQRYVEVAHVPLGRVGVQASSMPLVMGVGGFAALAVDCRSFPAEALLHRCALRARVLRPRSGRDRRRRGHLAECVWPPAGQRDGLLVVHRHAARRFRGCHLPEATRTGLAIRSFLGLT